MANRRCHYGILIYVKNALINFYIKIQNTVESSSFGPAFVALRIANKMLEALRYNLKKFGLNLVGIAEVYCVNKKVVKNSSVPASVLNKRKTIYTIIVLENTRLMMDTS